MPQTHSLIIKIHCLCNSICSFCSAKSTTVCILHDVGSNISSHKQDSAINTSIRRKSCQTWPNALWWWILKGNTGESKCLLLSWTAVRILTQLYKFSRRHLLSVRGRVMTHTQRVSYSTSLSKKKKRYFVLFRVSHFLQLKYKIYIYIYISRRRYLKIKSYWCFNLFQLYNEKITIYHGFNYFIVIIFPILSTARANMFAFKLLKALFFFLTPPSAACSHALEGWSSKFASWLTGRTERPFSPVNGCP